MNIVCERAEIFDALVYDRPKAIFEYFGLAYEAERPTENVTTLCDSKSLAELKK
jgi:hypothetical protein